MLSGPDITTRITTGTGGTPDRYVCPANQFVVGMNVRSGADIDALQVLCAPILVARVAGTRHAVSANWAGERSPMFGGSGGAGAGFSCDATSAEGVMQSLDGQQDVWIHQLHAACVRVELAVR